VATYLHILLLVLELRVQMLERKLLRGVAPAALALELDELREHLRRHRRQGLAARRLHTQRLTDHRRRRRRRRRPRRPRRRAAAGDRHRGRRRRVLDAQQVLGRLGALAYQREEVGSADEVAHLEEHQAVAELGD